ncbi:MAG: ABC transporter ATP-binding protein, partial [Candidatus Dormiibacterota bacterium]
VRTTMSRTAQMVAVLTALEALVPGGFLVAVTWIGARMAEQGKVGPGELVTVYAFAAFMLLPLSIFGQAAQSWSAGRVAAGRVLTVLERERTLVPVGGPGASPEPSSPTELAQGVLEDSLSGVRIEPGRMVAVTSSDPDELTELADRLGRYIDPPAGQQVTLGTWPLSALPVELVRETILVVDRESALLAGSVRDNLDPPIPDSPMPRPTLSEAVPAAQADEIVSSLPEGLEQVLPERGRSVSGGQRQRLVMARALRAGAPILVLEEPSSAVDSQTEAMMAANLRELRSGQTTVVMTTSPLLMESADEVLVLEGHEVVASGSHRQLIAAEARYRSLLERELA